MTKRIILIAALFFSLASCAPDRALSSSNIRQAPTGTTIAVSQIYQQISQEKAKEFMDADISSVIVDVRHQEEYDSGHIPGAILIPNENINTERPEELPDLDQIILVYCRSGRRSKVASQKLADMGYTHVYEFGGINDWTGEVVTDEE